MKVLVISPHPDDEVLGVGGTIAKRVQNGDKVTVCIVTKGKMPRYTPTISNQVRVEALKAHIVLGVEDTIFMDFPAAELDKVSIADLNEKLIDLVQRIQPDEVYIPHQGDMHFDHRIVAEAAMVALRPKYSHKVSRVYAYEVPSETGWNIPAQHTEFIPNVYENITGTILQKLDAMDQYRSQVEEFPGARSLMAIDSLAKYRGTTIGVTCAEAFQLVREVKL